MIAERYPVVSRITRVGLAASAAALAAGCNSAAPSENQSGDASVLSPCNNGDSQELYRGLYQVRFDDPQAPPVDPQLRDEVIVDAVRWYKAGGKDAKALVMAEVDDYGTDKPVYWTAAKNGADTLQDALNKGGVRVRDGGIYPFDTSAVRSDPPVTAQIGNVVVTVFTSLCQDVSPSGGPPQA